VATIAVGAVTGNPVLLIAGGIMAALVISSIVSDATGGEHGISAWVAKGFEAMGVDKEIAMWIGMGVEMALAVTACVMTLGASAGVTAGQAASMADKIKHIASIVSKVSTIGTGMIAVGSGVGKVVDTLSQNKITESLASQKDLEAILERIMQAMTMEQDFLEAVIERCNDLLSKVKQIVSDNQDAQTAILTGTAPNMA
jgi:hypothetical protein